MADAPPTYNITERIEKLRATDIGIWVRQEGQSQELILNHVGNDPKRSHSNSNQLYALLVIAYVSQRRVKIINRTDRTQEIFTVEFDINQ